VKLIGDTKGRRVLYIQYSNPAAYPPIQHSARILAENGCQVLVLGIRASGTEALQFPVHARLRVHLMPGCSPGILQKLHYLMFGFSAILMTLWWRPSWIYISDALACPIGLALASVVRSKIAYHEHDIPLEVSIPTAKRSPFMRLVLLARRRLSRGAILCIVPNQTRAQHVKRQTGTSAPVVTVWNCPSLAEAKMISPSPRQSTGLIVFFHGSIVPDRFPLAVIRALPKCPTEVRLHFAGYEPLGHRGYVREIVQLADQLGLSERVKCLGTIATRTELLNRCAEADVGLSLMPRKSSDLNMIAMVGASNKPFDYLLCGLPLLVSDIPEWVETFVVQGFGLACDPDDPRNIAAKLQWFVEHPEERERMGEKGRERILADWNYETEFQTVVSVMSGE
jgi:glycosyltransferase involved in cell wall biosynthesis